MFLVAYGPDLYAFSTTPRLLLVLPVGGAGLALLGSLAVRGDRAARWLVAYLAWALISALASDQPWTATLPGPDVDGGWIYLAAFAGCWAVGRRRSEVTRCAVTGALVLGLGCNVVLAVAQAAAGEGTMLLDFRYGRSGGFFGNPVYFAGIMAGAVLLAVTSTVAAGRRWWWWLPVVLAFVATTNLSGSRVALVGALGLGALALRRAEPRRIAAVVIAIGLGLALSWNALPAGGTARVADSAGQGGFTPRIQTWKAGIAALGERPILGWGPHRHAVATAPRTTLAQARAEDPDSLFFDAHNVVVDQAVTTGIVGLALVGGFAWTSARRAQGPLAWFAAGVTVTWLLEPMSLLTAPLALLALGLADRAPPAQVGSVSPHDASLKMIDRATSEAAPDFVSVASGVGQVPMDPADGVQPRGVGRLTIAATGLLAVAGLGAASVELVTDRHLAQAVDGSVPHARAARSWFPHDPEISDMETRQLVRAAILDPNPAASQMAVAAARRTTRLDPYTYLWWTRLGLVERSFGAGSEASRNERARVAYHRGLERNPWSAITLTLLYNLDRADGRRVDAARWRAKLCRMDRCPADFEGLTEGGTGSGSKAGD